MHILVNSQYFMKLGKHVLSEYLISNGNNIIYVWVSNCMLVFLYLSREMLTTGLYAKLHK